MHADVPVRWAGIIGLSAGLLCGGPASALTITQSFGINVNGANAQTINYQQFDSSLGTLTAVTFSLSGQSSGSFSLTAPSTPTAGYTLQSASTEIAAIWNGDSSPDFFATQEDIFSTLTTPTNNFNVARNTTKVFTLSTPTQISSSSLSYNSYFGYFTGAGSVSLDLAQALVYGGLNSSTYDISNMLFGGTGSFATLTYEYTPTPVPAAIPVLGAFAGFSFLRRQRRRVKSTK